MGGALLQLVAYGQQDVYLTGNPQITFWKTVYKRHTNFAIETIRQDHTGSYPNHSYKIARSGDLIHKCYLRVTAPKLGNQNSQDGDDEWVSYVNKFGHALIKSMTLKIGGVTVDTQTGEFLDLWTQLTTKSEKKDGYNAMTGIYETDMDLEFNNEGRIYYIPLQFFFCQHPGLALPLIALQYHEVQIEFEFRTFREMLCIGSRNDSSNMRTLTELLSTYTPQKEEFEIDLFVDYIYLDVDERRRMAQTPHEMLITQTKRVNHFTHSDSDRIDLKTLNHPVKELIWVVKNKKSEVDAKDRNYFKYSNSYNDEEIMETASLTLNGTSRIEERDNLFFRCIQPYQHHTCIPMDYIYVYSFALKPEEVQPSGSCNFSRMDSAYLNVTNNTTNFDTGGEDCEYVVYALNWNIFKIQGGQGGIAFSN